MLWALQPVINITNEKKKYSGKMLHGLPGGRLLNERVNRNL